MNKAISYAQSTALAAAIKQRIAEEYGVTVADIDGPRRDGVFVAARERAVSAVALALPHWSLPQLGLCFGGRHHTTILYTLQKTGVAPVTMPKVSRLLGRTEAHEGAA